MNNELFRSSDYRPLSSVVVRSRPGGGVPLGERPLGEEDDGDQGRCYYWATAEIQLS